MKPDTFLGAFEGTMTHEQQAERIAERISRRDAIVRGTTASATLAAGLHLASVPAALSIFSRSAGAQGTPLPPKAVAVLNFALTLEYLEAEFYNIGVATSGLIPAQDRQIFTTIQAHENAHVTALKRLLGSAAIPKPTFDFTGGNGSGQGPYADVFTNYETFKGVAQTFEDTGVRAYKGQAPALQNFPPVLTFALSIHSVEGRHASEVRRLRGNFSETEPHEGWITRNLTDVPGSEATYAGEENTNQLGVDVPSITPVPFDEVTEAFDEPLSTEQVLAIVDPFIV